ncbi:hypothetical protein OA668_00260 [Candidatus Pelagibacter sp.]|nr:hypothetical protein [Candidatus Pelagibacter sp.]
MNKKNLLDQIIKLFKNKKYKEVIIEIEKNFDFKNISPALLNLSAISKLLKKNNTKDDIVSALDDLERYYKKSENKLEKIEAVTNYITTCVINCAKYSEIIEYFKKATKLYEKCVNQFGYDEKLYSRGSDLYKYTLEINKSRKILSELIQKKSTSKITACANGYLNNYSYDWGLKEYFEYSKVFKFFFPQHETKNISEINYKENKKIKIGFISKDFIGDHSITYFLKNTLLYFDKYKFESFGISLSNDNLLKSSSEIKDNFDNWLDLSKLKNQQIIDKIQDLRIEILIDLMGLFHADRIEIFNSRIAPVQISWLGYPNTVGFPTIDYLIADDNLIKKDEEKYYLEKILRISKIWNCHSGFEFKRKFRDAPIKKNKFITFGSFNNFLKISDEVIEVWSNILKSIKNSKLILKSSLNVNKNVLLQKFKKYGVHESIDFYEKKDFLNHKDHLDLYKKIDIALDTFPYNGVTTTFEALWSGVPVITMKGFNMNSRCGESILKNANLDNLISHNKSDYLGAALYYSNNPEKLNDLRKLIHTNILTTSLFDSKRFSNDFQNVLLNVYKKN